MENEEACNDKDCRAQHPHFHCTECERAIASPGVCSDCAADDDSEEF